MSKLYFFRHGQASFGAANYDKLSPKGEEQSLELGKYLVQKKVQFDKIYVGPLERQRHTFELVKSVYDKNNVPIPERIIMPELKEHHGFRATRTGLPKMISTIPFLQKLQTEMEENPKLKKRNSLLMFEYFMNEWVEGKVVVDGFEPWIDFRQNVDSGLKTILENMQKSEKVGAFTSGGTISAIAANSLHITNQKRVAAMNFSIRNTSFTTFLYSRKQFNLLSLNEIPHLRDDLVTFV
ncbi:MAG: histidine phosphatase family protein [Saprospiraceae bacterium]